MVTKSKIYKVTAPDNNVALVTATTAKAAIAHVVGQFFAARIPTQQELVSLVQAGVVVETAGAADDSQQSLIPPTGAATGGSATE